MTKGLNSGTFLCIATGKENKLHVICMFRMSLNILIAGAPIWRMGYSSLLQKSLGNFYSGGMNQDHYLFEYYFLYL